MWSLHNDLHNTLWVFLALKLTKSWNFSFQAAKLPTMEQPSTLHTHEKADQVEKHLWSWSQRKTWKLQSKETEKQWGIDMWKVWSSGFMYASIWGQEMNAFILFGHIIFIKINQMLFFWTFYFKRILEKSIMVSTTIICTTGKKTCFLSIKTAH